MKRRQQYGADTASISYAGRMLLSAALLGGLALGVVSALAEIVLMRQSAGLTSLVFLVPLAMVCWIVVRHLWTEAQSLAPIPQRSSTLSQPLHVTLSRDAIAETRERVLARRL